MSDHLINDVIYTILLQISLEDVCKFSRIDKRFATVCKSERGTKEIKRKEDQHIQTLINEILEISGPVLFDIIRHNYTSYLSNDKYIHYIKAIQQKTKEQTYIIELLCGCRNINTLVWLFPEVESLLIKENHNLLKEFLYTNKNILGRLRREIADIVLNFNNI